MKWDQLNRGSIRSSNTRVRLARVEDGEFLERMLRESKADRPSGRLTRPGYQSAVRASLTARGGYFHTIGDVYNQALTTSSGDPLRAAFDAAAFDLIALDAKGHPVGALTIGTGYRLVQGLLEGLAHLDKSEYQVLGLAFGLPKLVSLAVEPEARGQGIGSDLMALMTKLMKRMGCLGIFGECPDTPEAVSFYETAGATVLPLGQPLNAFPAAGRHIVTRSVEDPTEGPYIGAEDGYRLLYLPAGDAANNDSEALLLELNQPLAPTAAIAPSPQQEHSLPPQERTHSRLRGWLGADRR